jgi:hypothetical protein
MGDQSVGPETPKVEPRITHEELLVRAEGPRGVRRRVHRRFRQLMLWLETLNKDIAIPIAVAVVSGVSAPLILDAIRGTESIQSGREWTGASVFSDSIQFDKGAGSTQNTIWRRRCRHIAFAEPFKRPPNVVVALDLIDAGYDGIDVRRLPAEGQPWVPEKAFGAELARDDTVKLIGHPSVRLGVSASNAQVNGFDLCVFTWSNTRLHSADVAWLAIPGQKKR